MPETAAPLVTAIVSCVNAAGHLPGRLDDLAAQTLGLGAGLEVIVVDSGSDQDDDAVARAFAAGHHGVRCVRTERETIYAAWNRGAALARGRYLASANADDRLHPRALETLARAAEESGAAVTYADALLTTRPGETFAVHSARTAWDLPDYSPRQALMDCIFGPVTLWSASVHAELGGFDPALAVAGDYAFFLRAALAHGAVHVPLPLGLILDAPDSLSADTARAVAENYSFLGRLRDSVALEDIYPFLREDDAPAARLAALADWGNHLLFRGGGHADPDRALAAYDAARELAGDRFDLLLNAATACAWMGDAAAARARLAAIPCADADQRAVVARNMDAIAQGDHPARLATATVPHPLTDALPPVRPNRLRRRPVTDYLADHPQAADLLRKGTAA